MAIDYGFTVELCTPYQPQQKGAVENLVGFVKRAFFRARRFTRSRARILPQQLTDWLVEVNTVRPCRATKEIPAVRLVAEQARLKTSRGGAGRVWPALSGHRRPHGDGHVPGDSVRDAGRRLRNPRDALALSHPHQDHHRRESKHEAVHARFPREGTVSYLPGPVRRLQLAAVAGTRKRLYFMRERCCSSSGAVGEG